jgi:hypothetical protein
MICQNCGSVIESNTSNICPICLGYAGQVQNINYSTENSVDNKVKDTKENTMNISGKESYTLAYTKKDNKYDEQTTYLIDEKNKKAFYFYSDGYEGITAEDVKKILNFLNITYFECSYSSMPERYYNEYKNYKL